MLNSQRREDWSTGTRASLICERNLWHRVLYNYMGTTSLRPCGRQQHGRQKRLGIPIKIEKTVKLGSSETNDFDIQRRTLSLSAQFAGSS